MRCPDFRSEMICYICIMVKPLLIKDTPKEDDTHSILEIHL